MSLVEENLPACGEICRTAFCLRIGQIAAVNAARNAFREHHPDGALPAEIAEANETLYGSCAFVHTAVDGQQAILDITNPE